MSSTPSRTKRTSDFALESRTANDGPQRPNQNDDRNRDCRYYAHHEAHEENPIPPRLRPRVFLLPNQNPIISPVGLPEDVEDIAHDRHPTD